jgi:hypothetical protein
MTRQLDAESTTRAGCQEEEPNGQQFSLAEEALLEPYLEESPVEVRVRCLEGSLVLEQALRASCCQREKRLRCRLGLRSEFSSSSL